MNCNDLELRQEVFKSDALKIISWLDDDEVSKYLNESKNVTQNIEQIIYTTNIPILTYLFNRNGSFYMITIEDEPVGYLKLVPKGKIVEMVIVIGDKEKWGMGLGSNAIFKGLKEAFFNWRFEKVIAKIHLENERSKNAFRKVGFKIDKKLQKEMQYSMNMKTFFESIC